MNAFWQSVISRALAEYTTPLYISAWHPVESALTELRVLDGILPLKHWLSFKTHPVAPLIRTWNRSGYGVEVVSEYEFLAARHQKFRPEQILVNGVAKHKWLQKYDVRKIRIHFDSLSEVENLSDRASSSEWRVGLRCHVYEEHDPDEPEYGTQFGMLASEMKEAIKILKHKNAIPEGVHFHLRTNVESADCYRHAISELAEICASLDFWPEYIDCGGGLPVVKEETGDATSASKVAWLLKLREVLKTIPSQFPSTKEIWFENGRFLTEGSCLLAVSVLDIKERPDSRYLICDGGRTNHALPSDWEVHEIVVSPHRTGRKRSTTVCGSTCMAFDRLIRADLPEDIEVGDFIIWMDAGAYHIPWETRFSNGLAKVIWCDENHKLSIARQAELFSQWWGSWEQ